MRQRRWRPPTAQMTKTRKSFMLSAGLSTNDLAVRALQQDRETQVKSQILSRRKVCVYLKSGPAIFNLQRGKAAFPPPCFLENRGLEGVWAPPWGVLEGSGRLLGGSWLQEASWVFCRLLSGGSWAAQEPSWGPRWTQVEGQDGSKIFPRRPKMSLRCLQDWPRSDFQSKSKEK